MGPLNRLKGFRNTLLSSSILALSALAVTPAAFSEPSALWPVAKAKQGFSIADVDTIRAHYSPLQLATAGNQALYAYLNMPEFFPHHLVASPSKASRLRSHPNTKIGEITALSPLGELSLNQLIDHPDSRIQGVIVLHKGAVVFEEYPGMKASDSHLWWSVAKVITGILVEILIDEGAVDPQQRIPFYLPEFSNTAWAAASVEDVLNMSSGIAALDTAADYVNPQSGIGRLIYAEAILSQAGHTPLGHDDALKMMSASGTPGRRYEYSSANTNILGMLIERVSQQRYADVVETKIWSKIGSENPGLLGLSPEGRAIAHGMFSSRLRDLARLGQLFTPSGFKPAVLSRRALTRISNTKNRQHYSNADNAATKHTELLGETPVTALAQWDALFADGDLFKSGYDGQILYTSPSRDVVIAVFSTGKNKSIYRYLRSIAAFFPSLNR